MAERSDTTRWRQAYRLACRRDGSAGVHRGMTALTREEWRAISLRRLQGVWEALHV